MIEELIGLSERDAYIKILASAIADGVKLSFQVEERDGVKYEYESKLEYDPCCFNLSIENDIVTKVRMG